VLAPLYKPENAEFAEKNGSFQLAVPYTCGRLASEYAGFSSISGCPISACSDALPAA
jgi:hypothetical protein